MTNISRNKQTYQKTKNYHELQRDHLKWVLDPSQKIPHPRLHKYTKFQKNPRELFFEKKLIFRLSSFEYDS